MRSLFNSIRRIIWFPFAVITCIPFMLAMFLLLLLYDRQDVGWLFFVWMVAAGLSMPIAARLKPHPGTPHMRMPKERVITTSLVRLVKRKASATGRSAIIRRLSPALQTVLKQPANQKPSAIVFSDARQAKARTAESADREHV